MLRKRILVAEDDSSIARILRDNLVHEGFDVECASHGSEALQKVQDFRPDLILLDIVMPGADGFEICRSLSTAKVRVPIIMLTARSQPLDKVRGLQLGADDYVTKPFLIDELVARIHAVLRRSFRSVETLLLGDVTIDFGRMRALKRDVPLALTTQEFAVLQYLAERPGRVVLRDELLRAVWGFSEAPLTRAVDVSMARLRRKIEPDPHQPRFIRTVHGDGYSLMLD